MDNLRGLLVAFADSAVVAGAFVGDTGVDGSVEVVSVVGLSVLVSVEPTSQVDVVSSERICI